MMGDPSAIIDPGMLARITPGFFPSRANIQESNETIDDLGQAVIGWTTFLSKIPCRIAPATTGTGEQRQENYTYTELGFTILLAGYYPTIKPQMRVVSNGQVYDIDAVQSDGNMTMTRLTGRQILIAG